MKTTRTSGRAMALALMTSTLVAFSGTSASACSHDDAYTVRAGDTLSRIASNCGVTLAALSAANEVDPYRLRIGDVLTIPAEGAVVRESSKRSDASDALSAEEIAAREARIAKYHSMRETYPEPSIDVSEGEWRSSIDIAGEGYAPGEVVRIAISGRDGDWITLGDIMPNDDGLYETRARIPSELAREPVLRVAAERPWGELNGAEYENGVTVAKRGVENGRIMSVNGRVISGGGCDLLMTRNGSYALTGGVSGLAPGDRVKVIGVRQEGSTDACVGGRAAIHVSAVKHL